MITYVVQKELRILVQLKNSMCPILKQSVEALSTLMRRRRDFSPYGGAGCAG